MSRLTFALTLALMTTTAAAGAEEKLHEVTTTPGKAVAGGKGQVSVTLAAKNGWKLNAEAPMSLKLSPGAGLTVDKPKLARKDLAANDGHAARFDVPFAATEAGQKAIDAEAAYVICQESACKQIKEKVTVAVAVDPAGKPGKAKK